MDPPPVRIGFNEPNDFKTSETIQPQEASPVKHHTSVLGIDIAKRIFHVVGMDERGQIVLRKRVSRHDLMPLIATLPRCSSAWKPVAGRITGHGASANMATR